MKRIHSLLFVVACATPLLGTAVWNLAGDGAGSTNMFSSSKSSKLVQSRNLKLERPGSSGPQNLPLYPDGAAATVRAEAKRTGAKLDDDRTCAGVWSTIKPDEMAAEFLLAGTTLAIHGGRLVSNDVQSGKLFVQYRIASGKGRTILSWKGFEGQRHTFNCDLLTRKAVLTSRARNDDFDMSATEMRLVAPDMINSPT